MTRLSPLYGCPFGQCDRLVLNSCAPAQIEEGLSSRPTWQFAYPYAACATRLLTSFLDSRSLPYRRPTERRPSPPPPLHRGDVDARPTAKRESRTSQRLGSQCAHGRWYKSKSTDGVSDSRSSL